MHEYSPPDDPLNDPTSLRRPPELRHGNAGDYSAGCRCEDCKAAHRLYMRRWRAARKEREAQAGASE